MNYTDLYSIIRNEIISNHVLMHWFTLIVAVVLLIGVWVVENRQSVLAVFLPLLSIAWAAAMVRFDFFIHRQTAYLQVLEKKMQEGGISVPLWETWRQQLHSTQLVVPAADAIASAVIIIPTIYLLMGPSRQYFLSRQWRGGSLYAGAGAILLVLLICSLALIPTVAGWGQSF